MTPSSGRLYDFFLTLQQKPVLVIGDVMLDRYVQGEVERLSPEAPIPILSEKYTSMTTGGAANVARNLAQLGANVSLIGLIGSDNAGNELSQVIAEVPQILFAPILCIDRPTTVKTRYLASSQQMLRVDSEVTKRLTGDESAKLLKQAKIMMANCDILILSDYAKGCLTPDITSQLVQAAHRQNLKVIIDPKSTDFKDYRGADVLTPNLAELQKATGITDDSLEAIETAARQILETYEIDQMLVTLSARGMMTISKENASHILARPCEVFDVSGAGDTVIALFAAGLLMGLDKVEAAEIANIGASLVVAKSGTACLAPGEILAQSNGDKKALSLDEAKKNISEWRQAGQKIGFTNGCFDLLHAGHIHILKQCAADSDRLIVGLNADSSVKKLKGADRPVQSEDIRAAVLANLPFVDAVVLFEEDTPEQLIKAFVPDILTKGGDYQIETIVGADIVQEAGGIVRSIPLLEGHSTTRFLNLSAVKGR